MNKDLREKIEANKDRIIKSVIVFFILAVITFCIIDITRSGTTPATNAANTKTNESTEIEQKAKEDKEKEEEEERLKKIRSEQDVYGQLLDSGKTYEQMNNEERKNVDYYSHFWNDLEQTFKEKYQTKEDALEKDKKDFLRKQEEKLAEEQAERNKASYDTGITYEQIARAPDNYNGQKVKFTGEVLQTVEDDLQTNLRIAVNGDYNNIILVSYFNYISDIRILENDNVTIRGVSQGLNTYESTSGKSVTIPAIDVKEIELSK